MKTFITLISLLAFTSLAADWPQWRGPDRTDLSGESGLLKEWPKSGPKQLWVNKAVGLGYSGPAIVNGTLYTLGAFDNDEMLIALDANSGKEKFTVKIGKLLTNDWGNGPRGTPTFHEGNIYTMSGQGNLTCSSASNGKQLWQISMKSFGGEVPKWGYTESPLIYQGKVIVTPGGKKGALLAVDTKTGKKVWQSSEFTDPAQYSSPIIANHHGKDQVIQLVMKHVVGLDPTSGKLLWKSKWDGRTAVIPTPIYADGKVFITTGYGVGCKLVSLSKSNEATDVYKNKNMKNHHGGVILKDGHLYGHSDKAGWTCMNFETGNVVWQDKQILGKGAIGYADGHFYCLSETDGTVALIEATTNGWTEKGRFKLEPQTKLRKIKGKIWVHPVILDGKLYLRDQELLHCYDVSGK